MILLNRLLLVVFTFCCGLLLYEINSLNNQYSELIDEGVLELKIIKDMSFNSNRRHILFYKIVSEKDRKNQSELIGQWLNLKQLNSKLFDTILHLNSESQVQQQLIQEAQSARKKYNDFCESKILLAQNREFPSSQLDSRTFDSLFVDYQSKINSLFLIRHQSINSLNNVLSQKVTSITKGTLMVAVAPVIAVMLVALLIYLLLRSYYLNGKSYY
jgi:hypothetical protein